jgi:hypothetical protein
LRGERVNLRLNQLLPQFREQQNAKRQDREADKIPRENEPC